MIREFFLWIEALVVFAMLLVSGAIIGIGFVKFIETMWGVACAIIAN